MTSSGPMDEFSLIRRYFAPLAKSFPGALDLRDDAAVLALPFGHELIMTKDVLVAGVHFLPDDPANLIARKLMAVNLSDLAAMGATPYAYALGVVLPRGIGAEWIEAFAQGLEQGQAASGISLAGGDTVSTDGPLVLSLTALGHVPQGQAISRNGARPGDQLYVSGAIGDGALGLRALRCELGDLEAATRDDLVQRYQCPEPRSALGQKLRGVASAAIDVSDGLIADLGHLCSASGVSAYLPAENVPLSTAARALFQLGRVTYPYLLTGGDDYELLFTVPPDRTDQLQRILPDVGVPVVALGHIAESTGSSGDHVHVTAPDGSLLVFPQAGFRHF